MVNNKLSRLILFTSRIQLKHRTILRKWFLRPIVSSWNISHKILILQHYSKIKKKVTNFVFVLVWFLSCLDWGFLKLVCFTKVLRAQVVNNKLFRLILFTSRIQLKHRTKLRKWFLWPIVSSRNISHEILILQHYSKFKKRF